MLRTNLRVARGTAGRLVAAGVAIVVGTAFVAAVLLASGLFTATVSAAVSASYAGADVVVTSPELDDAALARIRAVPGVAGADGQISGDVQLLAGGRTQWSPLAAVPTTPALRAHDLTRGALPADGQIALSASLAERLRVGVGDRVLVRVIEVSAAPAADGTQPIHDVPATVSGIVGGGADSALGLSGTALATPADALAWRGESSDAAPYSIVLAVADPGTSATQLRARIASALHAGAATASGGAALVQTARQRSDDAVDEATGGTAVLTGVVLAFAVLALFVAGIVITNTFSVLVAQRTRQLALLRCVGATSAQVLRGILGEAALLGLLASILGAGAGTALAALAAAVLHRANTSVPVPGVVTPTLASVGLPVLLGVVTTLLAALAPARAATRVSPLAALRPADALDLRRRTSRLRLAAALALAVAGAAGLAGGVVLAAAGSSAGIAVAMLGGALSFLGILLGAVLVVPATVGAFGRLAALLGGGPARVAAANAVRNPRRTTSTTSALLIGVTLVSLMTVGAASTQRTLDAALDSRYPVDVAIGDDDPGLGDVGSSQAPTGHSGLLGQEPAVPAGVAGAVRGVTGVRRVAQLRSTRVLLRADGAGGSYAVTVRGLDPAAARGVLADPRLLAPLAAGDVVAPRRLAERMRLTDGAHVTVTDGARSRAVTVRVTALGGDTLCATSADVARLDPTAPVTLLWVAMDPAKDAGTVAEDVRDAVSDAAGPQVALPVEGSAVERASYQRIIDTLLAVVIALLAVAVLIALIGVANTLSLSVIERIRESALLRALGLTRGQLRGMLALEGALVAGVGGLLGIVLGTVYGWAGAASLLGNAAGYGLASLALPVGRLAGVLAVAVGAGLLASVLPARRAARTPPVAALGE